MDQLIKKVKWIVKTFKNPISVYLFTRRKINDCTFKFRDKKINDVKFTRDFDFSYPILLYWDKEEPFPDKFINFFNNFDINSEFFEYAGLKFKVDTSSVIFFESDDYFDKFEIKNRVVLDVGGNVGDTALKFAKKGAIVYAFEPMPSLFETALENIDLNPQYKDKIYFFNKAISGKNGKLTIYESEFNSGGHSQYQSDGKKYTVDALTIDSAINEFNITPDILKMDCEGCEYNIILNSDLSIFKDIIFEYHLGIVKKPYSILVEKLTEEGFNVNVYNNSPKDNVGIIHAQKEDD